MEPRGITFVIGAGASSEISLPTGKQLLELISKCIEPPASMGIAPWLHSILSQNGEYVKSEQRNFIDACSVIKQNIGIGTTKSIDTLVHSRKDNKCIETVSKLTISKLILEAESKSTIMIKHGRSIENSLSSAKETWLNSFYHLITDGLTAQNYTQMLSRFSSISLIIFNYDRSVEYFLYNMIQLHFNYSSEQAKNLVICMNIVHPYGQVGMLPWQNEAEGENLICKYGESDTETLFDLKNQIVTFTEQFDSASKSASIAKAFINSKAHVYLGFAYDRLNMQILNSPIKYHPSMGMRPRYGTAYQIDKANFSTISASMPFNTVNEPILMDTKCNLFMQNYSYLLGQYLL